MTTDFSFSFELAYFLRNSTPGRFAYCVTQFLTTSLYPDRIVVSLGHSLSLSPEFESQGGGGRTPHMKGVGCLSEILN